jgi:hypothetical protein
LLVWSCTLLSLQSPFFLNLSLTYYINYRKNGDGAKSSHAEDDSATAWPLRPLELFIFPIEMKSK